MPSIDRIRIHNFRGASAPFSIAFAPKKPLVLIFGENGTGKTTIVDALDAIGNGSGGSLTTKSSTTLRTHLPTVGKKPSDMVIELSSGATTWSATLTRSGIVTVPTPRPPIQVLRRSNLQRFIDSAPGKRYEEIQHLIGVERAEKSEEALKRALETARQEFDDAARDLSSAESQLERLWLEDGQPGVDWQHWAGETATIDAAETDAAVRRSRQTREAIAAAVRAKTEWERAATDLLGHRQALATIDDEVAAAPALDAARAMQLAEMLAKVREHLAHESTNGDQCPVCGQDVRLSDLQASIEERLADLARYEDLSERRRAALERVRVAERIAEETRARLTAAADRVWTIANDTPTAFAPIDLPDAVRIAFAASETPPVERSAALIDACEPLVASLQADEDAAIQASTRATSIRDQLARAEESRAATIELEKILKGLTDAYDVMRRGRIEFTQRILDEVADECNRLYAEIHPNEGIAIAKIELDQQRRASINQTMTFSGYTGIAPQAYLSEAHLDTFGFCFWLAFAKREYPSRDAVLVLDDIFSSVDAPHLSRITNLIVKERGHFAQVIITTHQRSWLDAFRNSYGPGGLTDLIELQSWSLAQGIYSYQTLMVKDQLRQALAIMPFDRRAAASIAGIALEATLDRLTFQYRCQVPRKRNNEYTLDELLSATSKLFKKLELTRPVRDPADREPTSVTRSTIRPGQVFSDLREYAYVRNQVGAHHNPQGMTVSDEEVRAFADLAVQLLESLICPTCGQMPSFNTGTQLRCSCNEEKAVLMSPLQLV